MRIRYFILVILVLLSFFLLSTRGFGFSPADPGPISPPGLGLTPEDTSPQTLKVSVDINEDQDRTDHMSKITLMFRTLVVVEDNFAKFTQGSITCNGVTQKLGEAPDYTLSVPVPAQGGSYTCQYGRPSGQATIIDYPVKSQLGPQQPTIVNQKYTVAYSPDTSGPCHMTADATGNGSTVSDPTSTSSSDQGLYHGPDISSLSGGGNILLTRTCSSKLPSNVKSDFKEVDFSYESKASVEVTWGSAT